MLRFLQIYGNILHQQQKSMTYFIAIIILLWWSGTETTVSPRIPIVICTHSMSLFQNVVVMHCISHVRMGASSTMDLLVHMAQVAVSFIFQTELTAKLYSALSPAQKLDTH